MTKHLLIIGSGSVGKRHARNLRALGCRLSCVDPRADRIRELAEETPCVATFSSYEEALSAGGLDGVVVCSPPAFHVAQAEAALAAGLPVLLEKPVSPDLATTRRLHGAAAQAGVPILLGYTWRWWTPLSRVRALLNQGAIGRVRHVQFQMSAHLADWHPWERYQDFFMSNAALGGGALLDESHWVDLALWMFGPPRHVFARIDTLSDLDIDSDDNVDMLWRYDNGLRVAVHLDIFGRPHEKFIRFSGDAGTLVWSPDPNGVSWGASPVGWEHVEQFDDERNDMFQAVAGEFLEVLSGAVPSCNLDDGMAVMRVIEAARRSDADGRDVALEDVE